MKTLLLFCSLLGPLQAQSHKWNVSIGVFAGTQALDIASSRGGIEANPILGRGPFGARQVAIKGGLDLGIILVERWVIKRHTKADRPLTLANYVASGVTVGVATRNWTIK